MVTALDLRTRSAYNELAELPVENLRHAWDFYGPVDVAGSIGEITSEVRLAALSEVETGEAISLSLPINEPDPPLFGREPLQHHIYSKSRNTVEDRLDNFDLQASSQWDGLRHVRAREFGFFGGRQTDSEAEALGIEAWAQTGIVSRGVLIDFVRYAEREGIDYDPFTASAFDADDLMAVLTDSDTQVRPGDVLCVRFGWITQYLNLSPTEREQMSHDFREPARRSWAGLLGSAAVAGWLWDNRIAAVAADNPAVETAPGHPTAGSLHRRLIPLLGIAMGELFMFDELARSCEAAERTSFLFVSIPLNLPGGVASPANALAIL